MQKRRNLAKKLRKLARETEEAVGTAVLLLQECQSFDADARLKNLAVQGSSGYAESVAETYP